MAKYDTMRKSNRNEAVIRMHKEHPELSLKEIGDAFNISKQRASKILQIDRPKPDMAKALKIALSNENGTDTLVER